MAKKQSKKNNKKIEFVHLVFIRMPGKSYRTRLRSLLLRLRDVFRAQINSLVLYIYIRLIARLEEVTCGRSGPVYFDVLPDGASTRHLCGGSVGSWILTSRVNRMVDPRTTGN